MPTKQQIKQIKIQNSIIKLSIKIINVNINYLNVVKKKSLIYRQFKIIFNCQLIYNKWDFFINNQRNSKTIIQKNQSSQSHNQIKKKKKSIIQLNSDKKQQIIEEIIINQYKNQNQHYNRDEDYIELINKSFNNGKLASNLINIDNEEPSYFVRITLQKMISIVDLESQRYLENEIQEIQQTIFKQSGQYKEFESRTNTEIYNEDWRDEENYNQTVSMSKRGEINCQDYLREIIVKSEITDQYYRNEEFVAEQIQNVDQSEQSKLQSAQEDYFQIQGQDNKEQVSKSYFSGDTTYNIYLLKFLLIKLCLIITLMLILDKIIVKIQ